LRDVFISRLMKLAASDPKIFLVTGDLGFGVLTEFESKFPQQYLNVGVAEQNMTGVATGLALEGRVVFTYSIGNFPTLRCLEQIRNDACYHNANVKIVAIGGGFSYGQLGMSHHATEDLAILRSLPGITVLSPGDDWEAAEATTAAATTAGCFYLRLDKSTAGSDHNPGEVFELGRARVLRPGDDAALIVTGGIAGVALKAADLLLREGVSVRVISIHTIKPFDASTVIAAARETRALVTLEEHSVNGGLGSAVAEACLDAGVLPPRFLRMGVKGGVVCTVGDQSYLRTQCGLDEQSVADSIKSRLIRR
jgi:transketolase